MLGRIPAPVREIQTADEGHLVVHHHHFLMVRAAQRVLVVQTELQARMRMRIVRQAVGADHGLGISEDALHIAFRHLEIDAAGG